MTRMSAGVRPSLCWVESTMEVARTAAYGHFGRQPDADGGFSWEKTDLVSQLKGLA